MKLKLIVKLGEWLLGASYPDDQPRADMYLPVKILAMSLMLLVFGLGLGILAVIRQSLAATVIAILFLPMGVVAFLCWRNQGIMMLSNEVFVYRTFLGKEKVYTFRKIRGIVHHRDSKTLYVGNDKIHLESSAIVSKELAARINQELNKRREERREMNNGVSDRN